MNFKLEVIAFNIDSCVIIEQCGAHRIELCDNPGEGGTTPSHGFIEAARKKVSIELYPIIRPRGGDFLYSLEEFDIIKNDIRVCKKIGCDGIVTGMLNIDGSVDTERCKQLVELAYPLGVSFHRAFDRTADESKALEDVIEMGCERILTSGLRPTAMDGIANIESLIKQADNRIIIMPGSGIRSENIIEIAGKTGAMEFHTSARKFIDNKMRYTNIEMREQLKTVSVDETEIKKLVELLNST